MESNRCPECNAAQELGGGWKCGSSVGTHRTDKGEFYQGEHCRDRCSLAAKDREIEQLRAFLTELPTKIRDSGKPGPGGVDITGGIPSEVYVAIGRERYDDEYEVARETAAAVRDGLANYISFLIAKLKEPDHA